MVGASIPGVLAEIENMFFSIGNSFTNLGGISTAACADWSPVVADKQKQFLYIRARSVNCH